MALCETDYRTLVQAMYAYAGTAVDRRRAEVLEARLRQIARARGMADVTPLIASMRRPITAKTTDVVDGLVNCETSFFRDAPAFAALRDFVIPAAMQVRGNIRRLRILSAGCSTGQEAYSVAILLREHFQELSRWVVEIVGVDVSSKRVERATAGCYSPAELSRGVPESFITKYFQRDEDTMRAVTSLRTITQFRRLNLMEPWQLHSYDVVLLRNVLIYLDESAKSAVLEHAHASLSSGGFLLLGSAESLSTTRFAFDRASFPGYPAYARRSR